MSLSEVAALLALLGIAQTIVGWWLVCRFRAASPTAGGALPRSAGRAPISVLKPLHGEERQLEAALASICAQDYPTFQVVFGVQDPADPALAAVWRMAARFPGCDIAVVIDDTAAGANRKVANLINMLPAAKHDVLVIADSDIHAAPDYLHKLAATLAEPGIGLATMLYTGRPADGGLAARLGASAITHLFLPGALLGRALGRQDALGATMALRRETLTALGGLSALRDDLADDNVLGQRVRGLGLRIGLAAGIPATTVPERRLEALFRHELRWGRTIRALTPAAFAMSVVQYPILWALLVVLLSGGAWWALALLAAAWGARAAAARGIDRALGVAPTAALWHLPLRDIMSALVLLASFTGDGVEWRGQHMRAGRAPPVPALEV